VQALVVIKIMFNQLQEIGFNATSVKKGAMKNTVHIVEKAYFHPRFAPSWFK